MAFTGGGFNFGSASAHACALPPSCTTKLLIAPGSSSTSEMLQAAARPPLAPALHPHLRQILARDLVRITQRPVASPCVPD